MKGEININKENKRIMLSWREIGGKVAYSLTYTSILKFGKTGVKILR